MFKNNNDAEYYEGKRKGKDTCDAFLCAFVSLFYILSLSLAVWQSGLASGREDHLKKKKKRKMEENERKKTKKQKKAKKKGAILVSVLDLFFSFFFSRSHRSLSPDRFSPQRKEKERARREPQQRLYIYIYIYIYKVYIYICAYDRSNLPPQSALK